MPANRRYARDTVDSTLLSAAHDRQRREERGIQKIDLQRARRYGMKEYQDNGRIRYTYGGVVFIYCPLKNRAVTSWKLTKESSDTSGTKVATPILLDTHDFGSKFVLQEEERIQEELALLMNSSSRTRAKWSSHSVLVVDMSGSMRRDDVNGARCRSDGVWMALARDYVKKPLEERIRSKFDLVSIVVMKDDGAEVIMKHEPTTWVLYNKLVDMREWTTNKPAGHGYYLPAIDEAEKLLTSNANAGCSLSLLFFSDGSPSDHHTERPEIVKRLGELASKFGRRLSIACIGMAEESEDFSTLNDMVTEAKQYGAQASFGKPSLDADSLSNIITSLASSLTTSKTEMTELMTGKAKTVRMDIQREKLNTPDHVGTWKYYMSADEENCVNRFWTWDYRSGGSGFLKILDTRCAYCFVQNGLLMECPTCKGFYMCRTCHMDQGGFADHRTRHGNRHSQCSAKLAKIRMGKIVRKDLPSWSLAVKEQTFGEGAERIVRKVRFVDNDGDYVGPVMVAKESRFVESHSGNSYQEQMAYHREFMRTQDIASDLAKKFNAALLQAQTHFGQKSQGFLSRLPRIQFIEPMVAELIEDNQEKNVLIEQFLQGEYKKFNSNMGFVEDDVKKLVQRMNNLGLDGDVSRPFDDGLGAIEEGSEEESEEEEEELFDSKEAIPYEGDYTDLQDAYFPQAFSHFTYEKTKRQLMVVDLQGVFTKKNDGTKVYELTDPVIHKRRHNRNRAMKQWSFGRTDRGENGMKAFFETHKCTHACKLLGLSEVDVNKV
ncbi:hypothetical protein ACHAWF_012911 [Thalassiosira exigua]